MNSKRILKLALGALVSLPLGIVSSDSLFASNQPNRSGNIKSSEILLSCGGGGGGGGSASGVKARAAKKAKQLKARAVFKKRKGLPLTQEEKAALDN